ncbi:hypothetical protein [Botrimarina hoheduenensis]|uniref:hypothetical protein n=1 Tax=Botrimarina hoheduenensis TaxID=2528000 RepID=UPI001E34BE3B|nr:hypothetical protein [Botrimarina hoheduenensis]
MFHAASAVPQFASVVGYRLGDRSRQPVTHDVVGGRDDAGADLLGPFHKVAEHSERGVFATAAGRDFADDARAVAVFGDVRCRLDANPQRPVAPFDDGARAALALPISPAGELSALTGE